MLPLFLLGVRDDAMCCVAMCRNAMCRNAMFRSALHCISQRNVLRRGAQIVRTTLMGIGCTGRERI